RTEARIPAFGPDAPVRGPQRTERPGPSKPPTRVGFRWPELLGRRPHRVLGAIAVVVLLIGGAVWALTGGSGDGAPEREAASAARAAGLGDEVDDELVAELVDAMCRAGTDPDGLAEVGRRLGGTEELLTRGLRGA